ncbi:MAG TPA: polysaccharide deacetylase family protein [Candidatus Eisenbacteria bacterium]|nr:polysaccharide deacetylase family protein [Candidatus Eisenbacteria bacterium]
MQPRAWGAPRWAVYALFIVGLSTAPEARAAGPGAFPLEPGSLHARHRDSGLPLVAVLSYHQVSATPDSSVDTVTPDALRAHIRSLKDAGWTFRRVGEVRTFYEKWNRLPDKTVVLTFDDGYLSFLTEVMPILREENVPATLAVITGFVDKPPHDMPLMMNWAELRRVSQSGLVEIASHSHLLHMYGVGNPQGLSAPTGSSRLYFLNDGRYETRDEYRDRILKDLTLSRLMLRKELAVDVDVLVWPFGEHNDVSRRVAAEAGFRTTLGLEGACVWADDVRAGYMSRVMVTKHDTISGKDLGWLFAERKPGPSMVVRMDALMDPDSLQQVKNIEAAIHELWERKATDVWLTTCSDATGSGYLESAYFMNHQMPVRADVWSMTAIRMKRAGFRVWALVPALNLTWEWVKHPEWRLAYAQAGHDWPFCLSPDVPAAMTAAQDFMNDLAV